MQIQPSDWANVYKPLFNFRGFDSSLLRGQIPAGKARQMRADAGPMLDFQIFSKTTRSSDKGQKSGMHNVARVSKGDGIDSVGFRRQR